jgi:Na+/H+-dicarboxylate symporter
MVASVALGVVLGVGLKSGNHQYTPREIVYIGFLGEIFLRMLKMLILPLIVSSLINALSDLNPKTAGRLGGVTVAFFAGTTLLAVIEGVALVLIIKPGHYAEDAEPKDEWTNDCAATAVDTILDLLRNLFPDNLVQACFQSVRTCVHMVNKTTNNYTSEIEQIKLQSADGMNILGLVFAALAFGIVISIMGEKGKALADIFKSIEAATMKLVTIAIWFGPIGIVFLISKEIVQMDDPVKQLQGLAMYIATVITGLVLHSCIFLPLIYFIIVRKNPIKHVGGVVQALMTALGTDSSSATLPVSIRCMEENNHCDPRVARFVLPLGATVNMNGTALYEAVAAIYVSQVKQIPLGIGQVIIVAITATLAAIGAAGIPQAGLVTLLMVLTAVGLPPEYAALIIPVDWFLDRLRTVANVFGDTVGAAVVQKICSSYLQKVTQSENGTVHQEGNVRKLTLNQIDTKGDTKL